MTITLTIIFALLGPVLGALFAALVRQVARVEAEKVIKKYDENKKATWSDGSPRMLEVTTHDGADFLPTIDLTREGQVWHDDVLINRSELPADTNLVPPTRHYRH